MIDDKCLECPEIRVFWDVEGDEPPNRRAFKAYDCPHDLEIENCPYSKEDEN